MQRDCQSTIWSPSQKKKSAAFPPLHFRSRKDIFGATFKSVNLMIFYFLFLLHGSEIE